MTKVLLIDDDEELGAMLGEYIRTEGFQADVVHDGETGAEYALKGDYAIIVLDVMMPRMSGMDVLRRIRTQSRVPVLMLTARGDDVDRVIGLELGADDYVQKPCTPRELVARLRAILRRVAPESVEQVSPAPIAVGPLTIWPHRRLAEYNATRLTLTSTEFNLLEVLARNAGRVVSKADLSQQALGRPIMRYDRSIDVHMSSIRQKLGVLSDGRSWIQTVRGIGYQMVRE